MSAPLWVALAAALAVTGCGQARGDDSAGASPRPGLLLDFDSSGQVGAEVGTLANRGTGALAARISTAGDGVVTVVEGRDGGRAVELPAFHAGRGRAPLAVIGVTATGPAPSHELSPEGDDFAFGASFRLDAQPSGSADDNGDNLVQVGLYTDPAQYKIQLDHRAPSCRLLGTAGEVFVEADVVVEPDRWYTVTCARSDVVRLTLTSYDEAGEPTELSWDGEGDPGILRLTDPRQVLSIGGKLQPGGRLVPSASDQFNGAVDDVFLDIRRSVG